MVNDILKSLFMGTNNFYSRHEIMLKCWQNDPDVRPAFPDLTKQLKDMENQHKVSRSTNDYLYVFHQERLELLTGRQKNTYYGYAIDKCKAFHTKSP